MESMSPQQHANISQSRSSSLTDETNMCAHLDNKRRTKALSCRRQSAPSLVISKALTRSRTISRDNSLSPVSPETCLLVQSFLNPSRMFIGHVYAQLKTGLQTQERHMFLFTDILLISKAKSSTNFKLKAQTRVCEMWIANCMEEVCEGSTCLDKSFVMGWPTCNCVATFSSVEQKERWLSLIKSRIKEEKEKDNPKTIPLKVHAKDMGNFSYKTIAVSNSDSANEVIRLALQQFGIVGSVKDFQLWVSSRKDNAPYPLIAFQFPVLYLAPNFYTLLTGIKTYVVNPPKSSHEFPFSIQMSHLREPLDETGEKSDDITPPEKQLELLFEQLQSDSQCQFILRPSRVSVGHSFVVDPDQKPFKRRRSLINWAFWRGSTNQLDDPPLSPLSSTTDKLFGIPLSMVCKDDSLPKPIMDMLVFLFQEGPFTRGIFRRSAGAKACRELRDKLDSGIQVVPLSRQSIFVIAAVLKDFLRSIPGSLLLSDLYEKWMATMDLSGETEDSQLKAIQSLVMSLPSENVLLLKHVLAVLYNIQLHADDNQMNSFNLSICISPSMLWSPGPSTPEMEEEGTKKVCNLTRVMIENCKEIMEEDVTTLFDGFPQSCSHRSDVSSYQMTDSSYDSLENELNDESGSLFQHMQRSRGKPDSCSYDSVLTLSDCDLDQTDTDHGITINPHLLLPSLASSAKTTPALRPSTSHLLSPCKEPSFPKGVRQLRRSSEPAIWNSTSSLTRYLERREHRKGSYESMTNQGRSDVDVDLGVDLYTLRLEKKCDPSQNERNVPHQPKEKLKPSPLHLDTSCTNLCSPGTSPVHSSVSSLDSASSQHSADFNKQCPLIVGGIKASVKSSPRSPGIVSETSPGPTIPSPKEYPPKEKLDWSHLRISHGLHPNTWLKKDHRLSLSKGGLDDKDIGDPLLHSEHLSKTGLSKEKRVQEPGIPHVRKRSTSPLCNEKPMLETQHSRSVNSSALEKTLTVKELREIHNQAYSQSQQTHVQKYSQKSTPGDNTGSLPQSLFYGQSVHRLALHRKKSYSLIPVEENSTVAPLLQRRASEPGQTLGMDRQISKSLEHIHRQAVETKDTYSDPSTRGSKMSDLEQDDKYSNPNFGLSPAATKAVRNYFFWQGGEDTESNLKKSQEVALAVVHSKREWNRRCSDTQLEDFEKMLFSEESYV